jgi:hypothetical protein
MLYPVEKCAVPIGLSSAMLYRRGALKSAKSVFRL